ncbi:MAG TPA: cofactor-independent phosphoglycerate mutase [Phycisphaerae bacterium]|nr:cofactor-independent phosphoglycerate mutase [Phycisphaerae bacterium]
MKYAIVLPDGAADEPLAQLDGRTPLQAADIPNMDWVALHGRLGRVVTVPAGFTPGTDVATLSLFGYDPHTYYSGRAPIEAAARGLTVGPDELIFRCNFVTIRDGLMKDFTADHIAQAETDRLITDLNELAGWPTSSEVGDTNPHSDSRPPRLKPWGTHGLSQPGDPALHGCRFYSGVSYRNLMVLAGASDMRLDCAPPHDIPDQPVLEHLPRGTGQERVREIMVRANELLRDHEVNRLRREQGRAPVTDIWLWGQGRPTKLEPFAERFGVAGVVITGVDLVRGLAVSTGMKLIEVPGATGYIDTNYAGKGDAAVHALDEYDLVVVHVEAPDEAGHLGDADEKIKALERIDGLVVGPLLDALRRHGEWKMLVAPDHPTPCTTTAHDATPPPFCFAGHAVEAVERRPFSEAEAVAAGLMIDPGHRLMELFFRS